MALCEKAVEEINKLKPVFVCVCGDLVHHLPEIYLESDPGIRTRQVEDFKVCCVFVCVCYLLNVGRKRDMGGH